MLETALSYSHLYELLDNVPKLLGCKFKYSHVNKEVRSSVLKKGLQLLSTARLIHKVNLCDGAGLPLTSSVNNKLFKTILLDVGLVSAHLGLTLEKNLLSNPSSLINRGGLCEQFIGQQLRTLTPYLKKNHLYYWIREQKGSAAEIDYLIQHQDEIIPIEVKAGSTGSLKSLHLFMALRQFNNALRFNTDTPSLTKINTKIHNEKLSTYQLLSLPCYLVGQTHRLLNAIS